MSIFQRKKIGFTKFEEEILRVNREQLQVSKCFFDLASKNDLYRSRDYKQRFIDEASIRILSAIIDWDMENPDSYSVARAVKLAKDLWEKTREDND